ncbi:MAG: CsbD family protein, partial [Acidimicrobiia bacterium]
GSGFGPGPGRSGSRLRPGSRLGPRLRPEPGWPGSGPGLRPEPGGNWDQLKGKAKKTWGNLTDDDLDVAEGNYDELVGNIKEKTGESEEDIRTRLDRN